jgi:hypothetical protein
VSLASLKTFGDAKIATSQYSTTKKEFAILAKKLLMVKMASRINALTSQPTKN